MSEPSAVLRTVIASDNFLTREGLGCLLSDVRGIEVVARVDSHPETLAAVRQYRPDVLIVGIRTPRVNAEAALSAAQQLRSQYPNIGVVVIAEAGDGYALELLRSGAAGVGYLLDDRIGDLETLLSAVHGAHAGGTVLDPSIVNALVRRRLSSALDVLSVPDETGKSWQGDPDKNKLLQSAPALRFWYVAINTTRGPSPLRSRTIGIGIHP